MKLLEMKNASFSYDSKKMILKGIDMEFKSGIVYGIYGKSGAGKTTLLSLLAGLEVVTDGEILFKEQDLKKMSRDDYRANDVGIIFQSYNLLPYLTAVENIVLSMNISKLKAKNQKNKAYEFLRKVGIEKEKADRRILHLSGGEQQRVAIARSLAYESDVILADEPTGNLDIENEQGIMNILKSLAREDNKCVIIISHSPNVKKQVDEVYILEDGKLNKEEQEHQQKDKNKKEGKKVK